MIGKCLCGQVVFEIIGQLPDLYQCHCSLCKKATGTASSYGLVVGLENIKWIKGKEKINSYTKENGYRTDFCSNCGSPVPNKMNIGEYMWAPAGVLEGSINGKVAAHIFTKSKASWEGDIPRCEMYENSPENINDFMQSLKHE